jgi:hypothetical protein
MPSDVIRLGDALELDRRAYELRRSGRSLKAGTNSHGTAAPTGGAQGGTGHQGRDHRKDLGQGCFPGHRQQYQCGHPRNSGNIRRPSQSSGMDDSFEGTITPRSLPMRSPLERYLRHREPGVLAGNSEVERKRFPNVGEFDVPQVYSRLGEKEKAMASLERNFEDRAPLVTLLKVDPALDTLHSEPRFNDLLRRMNFPK